MKARGAWSDQVMGLGLTSVLVLLWSAGASGWCAAESAVAAARTTNWYPVPLPPSPNATDAPQSGIGH